MCNLWRYMLTISPLSIPLDLNPGISVDLLAILVPLDLGLGASFHLHVKLQGLAGDYCHVDQALGETRLPWNNDGDIR